MKNNRRTFIKLAGLAAAGLALAPSKALTAGHGGEQAMMSPEAKHAKRWTMVIDTRKVHTEEAIGKLREACHAIHNVPNVVNEDGTPSKQEVKWIWAAPYHESFPEQLNPYLDEAVEERLFPLLCNHCENPPCVRVCPTKATYQRPDGIVAMDYHRCIGCRYCMAGCPYGSRSFNWGEPRASFSKEELAKLNPEFPTRMRGVVEKCNFCVERLAKGQEPKCVEVSDGALVFGDLADPESEVRKVLRESFTIRRKPAVGTEPSVYYII